MAVLTRTVLRATVVAAPAKKGSLSSHSENQEDPLESVIDLCGTRAADSAELYASCSMSSPSSSEPEAKSSLRGFVFTSRSNFSATTFREQMPVHDRFLALEAKPSLSGIEGIRIIAHHFTTILIMAFS